MTFAADVRAEIEALRARAEKAERERDEARAQLREPTWCPRCGVKILVPATADPEDEEADERDEAHPCVASRSAKGVVAKLVEAPLRASALSYSEGVQAERARVVAMLRARRRVVSSVVADVVLRGMADEIEGGAT